MTSIKYSFTAPIFCISFLLYAFFAYPMAYFTLQMTNDKKNSYPRTEEMEKNLVLLTRRTDKMHEHTLII